jgi:dihydrofolate synthase/folylpolyglutamate synthase
MNYSESMAYLTWLGHEVRGLKFGLEKIARLMAECGDPQRRYPSVIIAGTNGKGSVAAMLDAVLRMGGWRVGLYTSPHLVEVEERIKVDGEPIPRSEFAAGATRIRQLAERLVSQGVIEALPSYFEFVTAIGLEYFAHREIDLAILEVGLGGRLDATNIVPPFVSVVTAIDIDHEEYLGSTLASIAAEKAAIIKPGSHAVIGRQPPDALEVLLRHCHACRVAPVLAVGNVEILAVQPDGRFSFRYRTTSGRVHEIRLGLRGRHQIENALAVLEALEILSRLGFSVSEEALVRGLENVFWPGRLEIVADHAGAPILFDGAHNTAGARVLRQYLEEFGRHPLTLVFGVMRDKRIEEMAAELFPLADTIIVTRMADERAADASRLADVASRFGAPIQAETVSRALERARTLTPPDGLICATGSLYLVGEAKRALDARRACSASE